MTSRPAVALARLHLRTMSRSSCSGWAETGQATLHCHRLSPKISTPTPIRSIRVRHSSAAPYVKPPRIGRVVEGACVDAGRSWPSPTGSRGHQFIVNPAYNRDRGPVSALAASIPNSSALGPGTFTPAPSLTSARAPASAPEYRGARRPERAGRYTAGARATSPGARYSCDRLRPARSPCP